MAEDDRVLGEIRSQRLFAGAVMAAAPVFVFFGAWAAVENFRGWINAAPILFGVFLYVYGKKEWRSSLARLHGRSLEAVSAAAAVKVLTRRGFAVERNMVVRGLGDIDLVVSRNGVTAPVEIKAYRSWSGGAERCKGAVEQVCRQRDRIGAEHAVIWLPDSEVWWLRRWLGSRSGGVRIAYGSPAALGRILGRLM